MTIRVVSEASPEDIAPKGLRVLGDESTVAPDEPQSYAAGLARTALGQGMALGFGDEIAAAVRTIGGEKWEDAVADERRKVAEFKKQNPKTAFGSELAGGIATPGLGLFGGAIKPAATILGRVGQSAKVGGMTGAIHGAGSAEGDILERAPGAAKGAAVGTAVGGAVPVIGSMIGGAVRNVRDAIMPSYVRATKGVDEAATEVLATKLRRANIAPADIANDLNAGRAAAFSPNSASAAKVEASLPEALVDTAPTLQRLGGSVYRAGNEAGEIAQKFVGGRQGGEPAKGLFGKHGVLDQPENPDARLLDQVQRSFSVKSKDYDKAFATIRNEQKTVGNAEYATAFKAQDPFDLDAPMKAWALKAMDEPGREGDIIRGVLRVFQNPKGFQADSLERFDRAKRSLDGLIGEADRSGNSNVVRLLTNLKHDMLGAVHDGGRNAAYQTARDSWGSRAELLNALQAGRSYLRGSEVTAADFKSMTKLEQAMFRLGVSEDLKRVLGGKALGPTADYTREFFKPNTFGRLAEVMPGGKTPERLNEVIRRESRISDTAKEVLGNSKTAQRAQDDIEMGRDLLGQAVDRFRSSPSLINVGIDALKHASEKAFGFRDDMATALAKRLFTSDRAAQDRILQEISAKYGTPALNQFFQTVNAAALAGTSAVSGQTAGAIAAPKRKQQ